MAEQRQREAEAEAERQLAKQERMLAEQAKQAELEIQHQSRESERLQRLAQDQNRQLQRLQAEADESQTMLISIEKERTQLQTSNEELRATCDQLQSDLHRAAETISGLRESVADQEEKERIRWEHEAKRVVEEESSILASAKCDMEKQLSQLRDSMGSQIKALEQELAEERKSSTDLQHELQERLEEATLRLSTCEIEAADVLHKKEAKALKKIQASEKAAEKSMVLLEQKDEEVGNLKQIIADLKETMRKNKIEEDEAEEEMDELHHENEELQSQLESLRKENASIKDRLASMSEDSEKLGGLKMELQMLEEERLRERSALESAQDKTSEDYAQVLNERDAANATVRNLEQQLVAARADLELAHTDRDRAVTANDNLTMALEAFQSERESEISLLTEQRIADEEAVKAAHQASLEAMKEANAAQMRDVQYAADKSVQNQLAEMDRMETDLLECRRESSNLRKALDEAIARLQTSQEDVIDRNLIKNVILDWHGKRGKEKRDVMILLGSILNFNEDEKDKALIGEGPGALHKVYDAVAAPLPPAKLNVDKIEGETVRDKWVSFLMAETGDDET